MESSSYAAKLMNKEAVDKLRHGQKNFREVLRNVSISLRITD